MKEKIIHSEKGDEVKVEKCPHCNSTLVVELEKDKIEVLKCENCKFKIKKK